MELEEKVLEQQNDTAAALIAGMMLGRSFDVNGTPMVMVPQGAELKELRQFAQTPQRIEQVVQIDTADSFIEYYNTFAGDQSMIFCDLRAARFVAVFDYHGVGNNPGWCKHVAVYTCPRTVEWGHWQARNGRAQNQTEFALFVEEHLPEIVDPPGATMLEIAKTLHAVKGVKFRKGVRLDNGQNQLLYEETVEGSAGEKGEFTIPDVFKIGLRLFEGGTGYEIEARLRYRLNGADLSLWYDLVRPHKIHEDAVLGVLEEIRENMGSQGGLLRAEWPV